MNSISPKSSLHHDDYQSKNSTKTTRLETSTSSSSFAQQVNLVAAQKLAEWESFMEWSNTTTVELQSNCDISTQNTPLHLAIAAGNYKVVSQLLRMGASAIEMNNDGQNALHFAAATHQWKCVKSILNHAPNLNFFPNQTSIALIYLLANSKFKIAEMILSKNLSLEVKCHLASEQKTALHYACLKKAPEPMVKKLIVLGFDVNALDAKGFSPLHLALSQKACKLAQLLILNGADVNNKNPNGHTPLHLAIKINEVALIITLAQNQANLYKKNKEGLTPVRYAIKLKKLSCIEALMPYASMHHDRAEFGSALLDLFDEGIFDLARKILMEIPYLHMSWHFAHNRYTHLHVAIAKNAPKELIAWLIERGAAINATSLDNNTPLHLAVKTNRPEIVAMLCKKCADLSKKNHRQVTPLELACNQDDSNCLIAIIINSPIVFGGVENFENAIFNCLQNNLFHSARSILGLRRHLNINFESSDGISLLDAAVFQKVPIDIFDLILQRKPCPQLIQKAIKYAKKTKASEIAEILANPEKIEKNINSLLEFYTLWQLRHREIKLLPTNILKNIARFMGHDSTFAHELFSLAESNAYILRNKFNSHGNDSKIQIETYYQMVNEYRNVPSVLEEALKFLNSISELPFQGFLDNLFSTEEGRKAHRNAEILRISRMLICQKSTSPLPWYLRGRHGPNGHKYLKIAKILDGQNGRDGQEWT